MEQPSSSTPTQTPEPSAQPIDTSMGTIITNVFASPREAFDAAVSDDVKHLRWVIPLFVSLAIMVASVYFITSNPTFAKQMRDAQIAGLQQRVDEGDMPQAQADQIAEQMGGNSRMFLIFGMIGGSVVIVLYYIVGALFLWLAGKFVMKSEAPYPKYLEIYGLASWIGIFGGIVTIVMMFGMDTMYASASGAMAVLSDFDPLNTTHKLLKSMDLFALWQAGVAGIGLSAIAKKENGMGIGVALVLWVIWVALQVGLGLGGM